MSKVKKSKSGGFLSGFVIVIIGIILLWYNEGRTVKMQSAITEASESYIDVESTSIDSKNEGKVIATIGTIDLNNSKELQDQKFGIKVKGVKLERIVEMYQWTEDCTTDDNNKKSCKYKEEWSNRLIDSSNFEKGGYSNPTSFKYENEEYFASNVKAGAFNLTQNLIERISYNTDIKGETLAEQYKNTIEGFNVVNNYITNEKEEPKIGDLRISYRYANDGELSMLGVQSGNTLTKFVGKKGKTILVVRRGSFKGKEILNDLTHGNSAKKWLLRVLGTILVMGGIGSLFSPLQMLTSKVPVLGSIVNTSTSLISTVLGLAISLIVIAIAWFRFRPILSIALIAIVIGLIVLLKFKKKK